MSKTFLHWRVFSHGGNGACIEFDEAQLISVVNLIPGLRAEDMKYKTITSLCECVLSQSDLPFLKHYEFNDEKKFRPFYCTVKKGPPEFRLQLPLKVINRIILSPWLPDSVVNHVKSTLQLIDGCKSLKIYKSKLVENKNWKKFAVNGT